MPAIHLFHRRTLLGGDDLQPAAVLTMASRLFQVVLLCVPVIRNSIFAEHGCSSSGWLLNWIVWYEKDSSAQDECSHSHMYCWWMTVWIGATVLYAVASFALEARIAHWSSQGAPTDVEPRSSKVSLLLERKLVPFSIALFLIWTTGIFAISCAPMYYRCRQDNQEASVQGGTMYISSTTTYPFLSSSKGVSLDRTTVDGSLYHRIQWWWAAVAALLIAQIAEVAVSWMFLWQIYRMPVDTTITGAIPGASSLDGLPGNVHYNHELVEEMWAERCAASCQCLSAVSCYMFGGRNLASSGTSTFGDVARALADFMESRDVLDVVPSDIVTGLIVLQRLQRQRVYAARQQFLEDITRITPTESGIMEAEQTSVIVVPKKKNGSAGSTIRKRTSSKNLVDQEEGFAGSGNVSRSGSEDFLLPLEVPRNSTLQYASHRTLYRIDQNGSYQREERALLDRTNFTEMYVLDEAARYAKYALAIYTWVLYLYVQPISGSARLMGKTRCSCCCQGLRRTQRREHASPRLATTLVSLAEENGRIEGDNLCQAHKNAILLTAGLKEADLVYVQLKSSFSDIPYCILLDHSWKSVVVSIRGTFSLEDCVTDVLISPEPLEKLGEDFGFDASGQYCHGGVMSCVQNAHRDLERHGLLDELLLGDNARYPGYTLRLVGHSLGAATCTLLSYMLRRKFPTLRCLSYSPPGCSFTWEMATQCKEWCTSCVLDTDLVPRLKVESMERLRDEILDLIGRIKVPKIEVAQRFVHTSALWGFRLCNEQQLEEKESLMESINDILYEPDEVPDSEYQQQLARFRDIQEERRRKRGTTRAIQLYPPGRILHLAKTGEKRSCAAGLAKCVTCCMTNIGSQYVPVWVDNDDLNEIVVSPTMGTDHFPNRMHAILEEVADEFGLA
jgi:sn1-specific diacylglycerol lipase